MEEVPTQGQTLPWALVPIFFHSLRDSRIIIIYVTCTTLPSILSLMVPSLLDLSTKHTNMLLLLSFLENSLSHIFLQLPLNFSHFFIEKLLERVINSYCLQFLSSVFPIAFINIWFVCCYIPSTSNKVYNTLSAQETSVAERNISWMSKKIPI